SRRMVVYAPFTLGTVDNHRKALVYLWKKQCDRTVKYKNIFPNPRTDQMLSQKIDEYGVSLVYEKVLSGTITCTATPTVRDPYNEELFIRMLSYTWRGVLPFLSQGKRQYNSKKRFPFMRERLCLLERHHMLLRDEDIRN